MVDTTRMLPSRLMYPGKRTRMKRPTLKAMEARQESSDEDYDSSQPLLAKPPVTKRARLQQFSTMSSSKDVLHCLKKQGEVLASSTNKEDAKVLEDEDMTAEMKQQKPRIKKNSYVRRGANLTSNWQRRSDHPKAGKWSCLFLV